MNFYNKKQKNINNTIVINSNFINTKFGKSIGNKLYKKYLFKQWKHEI